MKKTTHAAVAVMMLAGVSAVRAETAECHKVSAKALLNGADGYVRVHAGPSASAREVGREQNFDPKTGYHHTFFYCNVTRTDANGDEWLYVNWVSARTWKSRGPPMRFGWVPSKSVTLAPLKPTGG